MDKVGEENLRNLKKHYAFLEKRKSEIKNEIARNKLSLSGIETEMTEVQDAIGDWNTKLGKVRKVDYPEYRVVLEDGLSHGVLAGALGAEPIKIPLGEKEK
jgi:hypothetical protein